MTAYHGASVVDRELANWSPPRRSADAANNPEIETIVPRARDLVRNHGLAAGGTQALVDNVVGTGLRVAPEPDYLSLGWDRQRSMEWERTVELLWREYAWSTAIDAADAMNFNTMTALVFRSAMVNGETLAGIRWKGDAKFSTKVQLVEPDRLSNPKGRPDTDNLRGGIEINKMGAPIAYHILATHPGDDPWMSNRKWVRVTSKTRFGRQKMLHLFERDRIDQHRGVSIFAPVIRAFKMLDNYERYELQTAVANSAIAAFMETSSSSEEIAQAFDANLTEYNETREEWNVEIDGSKIIPVAPGDRIKEFSPSRPNSAYSDFVEEVTRKIGNGINMPYELFAKNFSKTNYSSARAALLEAWRFFYGRRAFLTDYWVRPVYELWFEEMVNKGFIDAPDFYEKRSAYTRVVVFGDGRGWVDPKREAEGAQKRMQSGISTLMKECAEQGEDYQEVIRQRARELALAKEIAEEHSLPLEDAYRLAGFGEYLEKTDMNPETEGEEESGEDVDEVADEEEDEE